MSDLGERLRAQGMRLTRQREQVLDVVSRLGHATADEIQAQLATDGTNLPASTIYRCLEALEDIGLITHTHLDHRAPSYQLASHDDHIHLVCRDCGDVGQLDRDYATPLAAAVEEVAGFTVDITHVALHGRCANCTAQAHVQAQEQPQAHEQAQSSEGNRGH